MANLQQPNPRGAERSPAFDQLFSSFLAPVHADGELPEAAASKPATLPARAERDASQVEARSERPRKVRDADARRTERRDDGETERAPQALAEDQPSSLVPPVAQLSTDEALAKESAQVGEPVPTTEPDPTDSKLLEARPNRLIGEEGSEKPRHAMPNAPVLEGGAIERDVETERVAQSFARYAAAQPSEGESTERAERIAEPDKVDTKPALGSAPTLHVEDSEPTEDGLEADEAELEARIAEALSAEEELAEAEARKLDLDDRRRNLEDLRLRAQARGGVSLPPSGAAASGGFGDTAGRDSFARGRGEPGTLVRAVGTSVTLPEGSDGFAQKLEAARGSALAQKPSVTRSNAAEAVEQVRKLAKARGLDAGKMNLTIRLDERTQLKMTISPRLDGGHELSLLTADTALREELRRTIPELREVTDDLPIDITDILVGEPTPEGHTGYDLDTRVEGALS